VVVSTEDEIMEVMNSDYTIHHIKVYD